MPSFMYVTIKGLSQAPQRRLGIAQNPRVPGQNCQTGTLPGAGRCIYSDGVLGCFFVRFTLGGNFGAGFALKRIFLIFFWFFWIRGSPPYGHQGGKMSKFLAKFEYFDRNSSLKHPKYVETSIKTTFLAWPRLDLQRTLTIHHLQYYHGSIEGTIPLKFPKLEFREID